MAGLRRASVLDKALRLVAGAADPADVNQAFSLLGQIDSPRGTWTFNVNRTPQQKWYLRQLRPRRAGAGEPARHRPDRPELIAAADVSRGPRATANTDWPNGAGQPVQRAGERHDRAVVEAQRQAVARASSAGPSPRRTR